MEPSDLPAAEPSGSRRRAAGRGRDLAPGRRRCGDSAARRSRPPARGPATTKSTRKPWIHCWVSGGPSPAPRTSGRKRRSSSESVSAKVARSSSRRSVPTPARRGAASSAARSDSGSMRSSLSAALTAPSRALGDKTVARSIKVHAGAVTGMPRCSSRSCANRSRRWVRIPRCCRRVAPGIVTSMGSADPSSSPRCSPAARWLRVAPSPQASTAAISSPSRVSSGRPTV